MKVITKKKRIFDKSEIVFLVLIILYTLFLLTFNMNVLSGGDDSNYAMATHFGLQSLYGLIYTDIPDEHMHLHEYTFVRPLAIIPFALSIAIFGRSEIAMLFPAILSFVITIPFLFLLIRRQFNVNVAKLTVFLFASSPFFIAFTRIPHVNSQLILTLVLAMFFYVKGVDENKVSYFYLAALFVLANFMTTEFKGILPLIGLISYFLVKKISFEKWKHIIISAIIVGLLYLLMIFLPYFLFGDINPITTIFDGFIHGVGEREVSVNYLSFLPAVKEIGSLLIFTPFMAFIFIPIIFGVGFSIAGLRAKKKAEYFLWLTCLATSIIFYIQGQPYPERQIVYIPIFSLFASLGIIKVYNFSKKKNNSSIFMYALIAMYFSFLILFLKKFTEIFIDEYNLIKLKLMKIHLHGFFDFIISNAYILIILIICISSLIFLLRYKKILSFELNKKFLNLFILLFLLLNLITAPILVISKLGIYSRPSEIRTISEFLKENIDDLEYSCVAGIHSKSLTYYTKKTCVSWLYSDLEWINELAQDGKIKYFIINKYYYQKTPGFGDIDEMRIDPYIDVSNDINKWRRNYPDHYFWLLNNTIEITQKVGLPVNNPYFEVYEFNKNK
jgi:4-amino-4-deoxy-L-arabinose transferase-like glycosyltransferase